MVRKRGRNARRHGNGFLGKPQISILILLAIVMVIVIATAIGLYLTSDKGDASVSDMLHPTPVSELNAVNPVVLYDQPGQKMISGNGMVEIYQNTQPDSVPFTVLVSQAGLDALASKMAERGQVVPVRFVIHWPGSEFGSHYSCERDPQLGVRIVYLHSKAEIEKFVLPRFDGIDLSVGSPERESFTIEASSKVNYTIYHEAAHDQHCEEGQQVSKEVEEEARFLEHQWGRELPPVIVLRDRTMIDYNSLK